MSAKWFFKPENRKMVLYGSFMLPAVLSLVFWSIWTTNIFKEVYLEIPVSRVGGNDFNSLFPTHLFFFSRWLDILFFPLWSLTTAIFYTSPKTIKLWRDEYKINSKGNPSSHITFGFLFLFSLAISILSLAHYLKDLGLINADGGVAICFFSWAIISFTPLHKHFFKNKGENSDYFVLIITGNTLSFGMGIGLIYGFAISFFWLILPALTCFIFWFINAIGNGIINLLKKRLQAIWALLKKPKLIQNIIDFFK